MKYSPTPVNSGPAPAAKPSSMQVNFEALLKKGDDEIHRLREENIDLRQKLKARALKFREDTESAKIAALRMELDTYKTVNGMLLEKIAQLTKK